MLTLVYLTSASSVLAKQSSNKQPKVDICHWDKDLAIFKPISIADPAVKAHWKHGDKYPETFYQDADGDDYGNPEITTEACEASEGYVEDNTDCDDTNIDICPGAEEVCNGIDDNCDGSVDEGVKNTYYEDSDGDGYGNPAVTTQACSAPVGYVEDNTDCDDTNDDVNPDMDEILNDGIDNDCDPETPDTMPSCSDDCWQGIGCEDWDYAIYKNGVYWARFTLLG